MEEAKIAFAVVAHPDDIEFMMAGTFLLLGKAGYELHYMNVANGSCGSATMDHDLTVATRTAEAKDAAACLGATFHEPLVDDLQIYYTPQLAARLCAVVRQVRPEILLVPSPLDYMEEHVNVSRLMVTAAFCRGMLNFVTDPVEPTVEEQVAIYHAMPAGLQDQLRNPVKAHLYVDVSGVMEKKRQALAHHRSQKDWLDVSQGIDSYLKNMQDTDAAVGLMSARFEYAEGWQRHSHLGFAAEQFDPLTDALGKLVFSPNRQGDEK